METPVPKLKKKWAYYVIRRDQVNNGFEGTGNTYNRIDDRFSCKSDAEERLAKYESGRQHHQEYEITQELPEGCLIT